MTKVPTNKEYIRLVNVWQTTDCQKEKDRVATIIFKGLEKLIWKLVKRKTHWMSEEAQEDCFSEANLIILKHVLPNFDAVKAANCKFSNYAANWVINGVIRAMDKMFVVHIPQKGRKEVRDLLREGKELTQYQRAYSPKFIYWDKPTTADTKNSGTVQDHICSEEGVFSSNPAFESIDQGDAVQYTRRLIGSIKSLRDRRIIEMKMDGKTYREIGVLVSLSKQRVEQVYTKSLKDMKTTAARWDMRARKPERGTLPKTTGIEVLDLTTKGTATSKAAVSILCRQELSKRIALREQSKPYLD